MRIKGVCDPNALLRFEQDMVYGSVFVHLGLQELAMRPSLSLSLSLSLARAFERAGKYQRCDMHKRPSEEVVLISSWGLWLSPLFSKNTGSLLAPCCAWIAAKEVRETEVGRVRWGGAWVGCLPSGEAGASVLSRRAAASSQNVGFEMAFADLVSSRPCSAIRGHASV